MTALVLEGETLGERHRHYNKLLKKAIADRPHELDTINYEDSDIDNLLKIDVACKTKNVEYILEVLKGEDLLYVSRALKRCAWLVTEPQHAHIVNPHHLHRHLFPHMTTKAIKKLMLHIRTHLTDEKRVEEFYSYTYETSLIAALKWLPNCSLGFKLEAATDYDIPLHIFKRMYKKDPNIIIQYIKRSLTRNQYPTHVARLLAKSHPEDFLNLVDSIYRVYDTKGITCGSSATQVMLKKCPQRIIDNFHHYYEVIHIPTFVRYLKKERDIKQFLYRHPYWNCKPEWFTFDNLKYFLDEIPQEDTTNILKRIFHICNISDSSDDNDSKEDDESDSNEDEDNSNEVDDNNSDDDNENSSNTDYDNDCSGSDEDNDDNSDDVESDIDESPLTLTEIYHKIEGMLKHHNHPAFVWYEFAPFEVAMTDLQKLVYAESTPKSRHSILLVLLACARRVPDRIQTVLQYYHDRHINEDFQYKVKFVHQLVTQIGVHNLHKATWNLLDDLFRSMELYVESDKKPQICIKTIIMYKVIHDECVPEIIEEKFEFDTLKTCQKELSLADGNKIFDYLYKFIKHRIQKRNITHESEFNEIVTSLNQLWNLLNDWKRVSEYYKIVVDKIKELLDMSKNITWNVNLSPLYKMMGRWRRHLFSESLSLCASEEACLNVLKHEPRLLARHSAEMHALRTADAVTPRRLLTKLRIYWPHTIGKEWTEEYFAHINDATGHKAIIKGLYLLRPSHELLSFIKQHAPGDRKIEWTEENELQTNIRRHIAKNMHLARPPLSTEVVLWYAKGDYLQYAQLSLNSIYYNLKSVQVNEHIIKLVTGPVSVQKHGIRQAYDKLKPEELKTLYHRLWKNSKNCTIRAVLFTCTFKLLCKETDESLIKDLWMLISTYIDDLNEDDNKIIFNTLGNVHVVPYSVKAEFLMKSYIFLKSLPEKADCETPMTKLITHAPDLMEYLDPDFVSNILLETADEHILNGNKILICVVSAYVLCTKHENIQDQRFLKNLAPILNRYISLWVKDRNDKVRSTIGKILRQLCSDFSKYVFEKHMIMPTNLFKKVYLIFMEMLSQQNDFVLLTNWNLAVDYIVLVDHIIQTSEKNYTWIEIQRAAVTPFGKICLKHLKEDIKKYFPSIYVLFASACRHLFENYQFDEIVELDLVQSFLDVEVVESYLLSLALLPGPNSWLSDEKKTRSREVSDIISKHPSELVKILYYRHFQQD